MASEGLSKFFGLSFIELIILGIIVFILILASLYGLTIANVRSKIAQANSDMYSIGIALESYYTNYNNYPCENFEHPLNVGIPDESNYGPPNSIKLLVLTTPISYLKKLPVNPFAKPDEYMSKYPPFTYHYAALNDLFWPNDPFFLGKNEEHIVC